MRKQVIANEEFEKLLSFTTRKIYQRGELDPEVKLTVCRFRAHQQGILSKSEELKITNQIQMLAPCNVVVFGMGPESEAFALANTREAAMDFVEKEAKDPVTLFISDSETGAKWKMGHLNCCWGHSMEDINLFLKEDPNIIIAINPTDAVVKYCYDQWNAGVCWVFAVCNSEQDAAILKNMWPDSCMVDSMTYLPGKLRRAPVVLR